MNKRVVVTGMGIASPLGVGVDYNWNKILQSESGVISIKDMFADLKGLNSTIAGILPVGDKKHEYDVNKWLTHDEIKKSSDFIQYAMCSSIQAYEDSGLLDTASEEDKLDIGVIFGSGIGGLSTIYNNSVQAFNKGCKGVSPLFVPVSLINMAPGAISIKYGLKGICLSPVTACATAGHAIGMAYQAIKYGEQLAVVCGGSEAPINNLGMAGFDRMRALSRKYNDTPEQASRPWDKNRDGFVIAEGSATLVLEEYEYAKKRGAHIYAEVVGYGYSGDANHIVQPQEDGEGAFRAVQKALKCANINAESIDYINAHGTSTPVGDMCELRATSKLFGNANVVMSSTKSYTGHLLGAAGGVEAIYSIKALQDNIAPKTLNLEDSEDNLGIHIVSGEHCDKNLNYVLSNSFGFGGTNVSLIFQKV